MLNYDYLIIGGGISGTAAAEAARSKDSQSKIAIIEEEPHLLYSRVFLPAYCRGEIGLDKVMLRTLGDYEKNRIDLFLSHRVLKIDFLRQEVFTSENKKFSYQKLLLSTGGKVKPWEFEKEFGDKVLRLQTLDDAERFKSLLVTGELKKVLVVGSSFIAAEFINILKKYGVGVTVISKEEYFWKEKFDDAGLTFLKDLFYRNDVEFIGADDVSEIKRDGKGLIVFTKGDRKISCDAVAVGIGLEREADLGEGVLVGSGSIRVNEFLEAQYLSSEMPQGAVFASGDVMEYFDAVSSRWRISGNWTHAFMSGRTAALNMTGGRVSFGLPASYSIRILGAPVSFLGDTDKRFAQEVISRENKSEGRYARFFLKEGRLIGAALFNVLKEKPVFIKMIESRENLSAHKNALKLS